jgi:hypothetical protein
MTTKYVGRSVSILIDDGQTPAQTAGATAADQLYFVLEKGANSTLPVDVGMMFFGPTAAKTLVSGDRLLPLSPEKICKTTASVSVTKGSVDASDDCEQGNISDGIVKFSGSLDGLFHYDAKTGRYDDVTSVILNKFFDMVQDTKTAITIAPKNDGAVYMIAALGDAAPAGGFQQYLCAPINLNSDSLKLGNGEVVGHSLAFDQAPGVVHLYERTV